jgi:hypothetical protein
MGVPNPRAPALRPYHRGDFGANPMAIGGYGPRPSQGSGPSMPNRQASVDMRPLRRPSEAIRRPSEAQYSGSDPRMLDARPASHHPSRDVRPASHHPSRQPSMPPRPPLFAGRPSQAGRVGSHRPSNAAEIRASQVGRMPSQPIRGPSASQHGGFSDQDFVKVGRAPSRSVNFVEPRQPSQRPSAHPADFERPASRCPSAHEGHDDMYDHPGQVVRQPSQGMEQQYGAPAQQYHQRPAIDTSIYHGQVGASGQRWQGIVRKWDNYMAGGGYQ